MAPPSGLLGHRGLLLKSGAPALWTPSNLRTPAAIYFGKNATRTVSQLNDLSGNNYHVTQGTGANQPVVNASGIGSQPDLTFDGTDDHMSNSSAGVKALFQNKSGGFLLAVAKKNVVDGAGVNRNIVSMGASTAGGGRITLGTFGNKPYLYTERVDGAAGTTMQSASDPGTSPFIELAVVNWATAAAEMRRNGAIDVSLAAHGGSVGNTSNTATNWPMGIMAFEGSPVSTFGEGNLAAYVVGNSYPSRGEQLKLEGWAAWDANLASILPGGHSYKTAAPIVGDGDPAWANAVAGFHFDNIAVPGYFLDETGALWSSGSGAVVSAAQSKFGGSSMLFNATTNAWISKQTGSASPGSSNFSVSMWVRPTSLSTGMVLMDTRAAGLSNGMVLAVATAGHIFTEFRNGSTYVAGPSGVASVISVGTWAFVEFLRIGTTYSIYVNGTLYVTLAAPSAGALSNAGCLIGRTIDNAAGYFTNGHIDEWSYLVGPRVTGPKPLPTAAFVDWV